LACVLVGSCHPVVFVENVTATRYKNILSTYLTPMVDALDEFHDAGAIFQQDNARAHTAHAVRRQRNLLD